MKEVIKEAKSVEEAINLACEELEVTKDDVTFEILELPKKGIFGFRNTMAKVKVALINEDHLESDAESKEKKEVIREEDAQILANKLVTYLKNILVNFGITDLNIESNLGEEGILNLKIQNNENFDLLEDSDFIIALQRLGNTYLSKVSKEVNMPKLTVHINDVLEKQKAKLIELVTNMASVVKRTGNKATMEPMNSYERMIVHNTVSQIEGVGSGSIGEGKNRRVVLFCSEEK